MYLTAQQRIDCIVKCCQIFAHGGARLFNYANLLAGHITMGCTAHNLTTVLSQYTHMPAEIFHPTSFQMLAQLFLHSVAVAWTFRLCSVSLCLTVSHITPKSVILPQPCVIHTFLQASTFTRLHYIIPLRVFVRTLIVTTSTTE